MRTTHKLGAVVGAAVTGAALGTLIGVGAGATPPAAAAPACSNYHLNNFMFGLSLSNGQSADFDWDDNMGTTFSTKDPNARLDVPGTRGFHGNALGGLQGTKFDFTVHWVSDTSYEDGQKRITSHFTGTIVDSSTARGTAVDDKGASVNWSSTEPFICTDAPAEQAQPAAPAGPTKCTGLGIAPPGKTCADLAAEQAKSAPEANPAPAEPAPTNAVTMTFKRAGLTNVTATFSNTSKVSGQCHYDAQDVNGILPGKTDDFPIGANGNVTRTYLAPPLLSTYHAVVSCTGDFNGQNIEFGHAEQDVSG
jgi:hypothetical protein